VFSRAVDVPAVQASSVQEQLVQARKAELSGKNQPVDGADYPALANDPENHLRLLRAAYKKAAGPDPEPAEQPPEEADIAANIRWFEDELRQRIAVSDAELFALAKTRAEEVQSLLLSGTDSGIDPGRVFLVAPVEGKAADTGVVMELGLN
jgi:hypothetical protein